MTKLPRYLKTASAEDQRLFALESQLSEVRLAIAQRELEHEIAYVELALLQALANDLEDQIQEIERARK